MQIFLPDVSFAFAKDICLDNAYCKEGLKINTQYGLVEINKQNCLKYGWVWFESAKACDIND